MDRHLPDDQLDRALLGLFAERRDELLATAPTPHLVAARIAAATAPTTAHRRRPALVLPMALLLTLLAAAAIVVGSGLLQPSPIPAERGVFTPTGSLAEGQVWLWPAATLLADGRVLVVGGGSYNAYAGASAEVWDPRTGTFSPAGSMSTNRMHHTATLLRDGRVLVVGGSDQGRPTRSVEIWDPRTSTFSPTGSLDQPRSGHIALLLHDGRVLVVGGGPTLDFEDAEIWDPVTDAFSPAGWPVPTGFIATAVVLRDGRVLVVGRDSAGIWDPATGIRVATGAPIGGHVAVASFLLPDGRVMVLSIVGGHPTADVWDPASQSFSAAGSSTEVMGARLVDSAGLPAAVLLDDGRVLVAGGGGAGTTDCTRGSWCQGPTDAAALWDPATRSFSPTGSMGTRRDGHTMTVIKDGRVLVVGDQDGTAELFALQR